MENGSVGDKEKRDGETGRNGDRKMVLRTVGVLRTVMGVRLWSRCDGGMTKGETERAFSSTGWKL
jgi:hypothetical protein